MGKEILGMASAIAKAKSMPYGSNMAISAQLVAEMVERIGELEKSGNEMEIIIAELRSEALVLEHQVTRYKKEQDE